MIKLLILGIPIGHPPPNLEHSLNNLLPVKTTNPLDPSKHISS